MLCGLPQQGRSLIHFRLFNWISLPKTVASAGNVRKRNLKFKKYSFLAIEFYIFFREPLKYLCSSYSSLDGLRKYHIETLDSSA